MAVFAPTPVELVIVLVIVLIVFGPKRLPDLGRSLGGAMREFKDSVTGKDKDELPAADAEQADEAADEAEPVPSAAGKQDS